MDQADHRLEHWILTVPAGTAASTSVPSAPAPVVAPAPAAPPPSRRHLGRVAWSWILRGQPPPRRTSPGPSGPRSPAPTPGPGGGAGRRRWLPLVLVVSGVLVVVAVLAWTMAGGHSKGPSGTRPSSSATGQTTVATTSPTIAGSSSAPSTSVPAATAPTLHLSGAAATGPPTSSAALLRITPTVTGLSPAASGGCSTITISGSNLSMSEAVRFGNSGGSVVSATSGSMVVKVPNLGTQPTTVPVVVQRAWLQSPQSAADVFNYTGLGSCQPAAVKKKSR